VVPVAETANPVKKQGPVKKQEAAQAPKAQPTLGNISKEVAGEMEGLHSKNATLKTEVNSQNKSIASLNTDNSTLKARLAASDQRSEALLAKMKDMRNQLLVAGNRDRAALEHHR